MTAIGPLQDAWLRTLEAGEHTQGTGVLCLERKRGEFAFCCLGLAAQVLKENGVEVPWIKDDTRPGLWAVGCYPYSLPVYLAAQLGLRGEAGDIKRTRLPRGTRSAKSLASMNDNGWAFAEIAAFCRKYPAAVFTEPK